jgi:hypothetical protein
LQKNHLAGFKQKLLKVSFWNVQQLMEVKKEVSPMVSATKAKAKTTAAYADLHRGPQASNGALMQLQVMY